MARLRCGPDLEKICVIACRIVTWLLNYCALLEQTSCSDRIFCMIMLRNIFHTLFMTTLDTKVYNRVVTKHLEWELASQNPTLPPKNSDFFIIKLLFIILTYCCWRLHTDFRRHSYIFASGSAVQVSPLLLVGINRVAFTYDVVVTW